MRITSLLIGLALVFAFSMAPSQSMAQAAPKDWLGAKIGRAHV